MKYIGMLFLLLGFGCTNQTRTVVISASLIDSNKSVKISGLDYAVIADINRDTSHSSPWPGLFAVYRMPLDTDMKDYQKRQPGKYLPKDSVVIFTPDTPFKKGQVYFLRCYQYQGNKSVWDYLKNKRRPGELRYTDLIFKY